MRRATPIGLFTLAVMATSAHAASTQRQVISIALIGQDQPAELKGVTEVRVIDPSVAEAHVFAENLVMVSGLKWGTTTLEWKNAKGETQTAEIDVAPPSSVAASLPARAGGSPALASKAPEVLHLVVGTELLLPRCDLAGVSVEDPDIASIRAVSDTRAAVSGLKAGKTRVTYWNSQGDEHRYVVQVEASTAHHGS